MEYKAVLVSIEGIINKRNMELFNAARTYGLSRSSVLRALVAYYTNKTGFLSVEEEKIDSIVAKDLISRFGGLGFMDKELGRNLEMYSGIKKSHETYRVVILGTKALITTESKAELPKVYRKKNGQRIYTNRKSSIDDLFELQGGTGTSEARNLHKVGLRTSDGRRKYVFPVRPKN